MEPVITIVQPVKAVYKVKILVIERAQDIDNLLVERFGLLLAVRPRRFQRTRFGQHLVHVVGISPRQLLDSLDLRHHGVKLSLRPLCLLPCLLHLIVSPLRLLRCIGCCVLNPCEALLLPRYLELRHRQVFLGAADLAALDVRVPGGDHVPVEIVLQDAVRLFQYRLAVLLEDWLTNIVHCWFRRPFLAPADLRDDLLDSTTQRRVFAPL